MRNDTNITQAFHAATNRYGFAAGTVVFLLAFAQTIISGR